VEENFSCVEIFLPGFSEKALKDRHFEPQGHYCGVSDFFLFRFVRYDRKTPFHP